MLISKQHRLTREDLDTVEKVMTTYLDDQWGSVGLGFNPWNYTSAELHGILLSIFSDLHILNVLELTPSEMLDFCLDIELLYNNVPYHSFNHAVDVVVKLYYVLHDLRASSYLASYDIAVLLISGLCHDSGHPGMNNLFQKNANTQYAKRYPDAILERYSADLAVEYIQKHRLFRNVEKICDPLYVDSTVTETNVASRMIASLKTAIIYTDMTRHFELVEVCKVLVSILSKKARRISEECLSSSSSEEEEEEVEEYEKEGRCRSNFLAKRPRSDDVIFNNIDSRIPITSTTLRNQGVDRLSKNSTRTRSPSEPIAPSSGAREFNKSTIKAGQVTYGSAPSRQATQSGSNLKPFNCNNSNINNNGDAAEIRPRMVLRRSISMHNALLDSTQRQSLINILLHSVDIFNPILPWDMCKKWSCLMMQESFCQGDLEKRMGLPVSPNMDRETTDQRQVSLDFGSIIIRPLFTELVLLFPVEDTLLAALDSNMQMWGKLSNEDLRSMGMPVMEFNEVGTYNPESSRRMSAAHAKLRLPGEARRLSVAAGTVDIPEARLEMIRRHSHEGFEAMHHRMVGRLFSKHLGKIQELRKASYSGAPKRRQARVASLLPESNSIRRDWRPYDMDLLSPVTENNPNDDSGGLQSATIAASGPPDIEYTGLSGNFHDQLNCDHQTQITSSLYYNESVDRSDVSANDRDAVLNSCSAWMMPNSHIYTTTPVSGGLSGLTPQVVANVPSSLENYQIQCLINRRQNRSTSLDPTILSSLPTSYVSLRRNGCP